MKKIFFILSFAFLITPKVFGQAQVDIPFYATDGLYTITLPVGLDLRATTCVDSLLGEFVFNVMPPPGVFDIRFNLAPYGCGEVLYTLKDYRPPGDPPAFPFTGMIVHILSYETRTTGLPIDITYNLPVGTIMTITDFINGSFLNLGPFTGQGVVTIPGSYNAIFNRALLNLQYDNIVPTQSPTLTSVFTVNDSWNMVSFPGLHPNSMSVDTLYRYRNSEAEVFSFNGTYNQVTHLKNGKGYWLKHSGDRTYNWSDTIQNGILYQKLFYPVIARQNVSSGWNLIGVYDYEFLPNQLVTIPPGLINGLPFEYIPGSGYQPASLFEPGKGYWILLTGYGKIIYPNRSASLNLSEVEIFKKEWPKINISDAAENKYTLYTSVSENNLDFFSLPPKPPSGIFDVRFSTDRFLEDISIDKIIEITGAVYPIRISVDGIDISIKDLINGSIFNTKLKSGEEIIIDNNLLSKLNVSTVDFTPKEFVLYQNYPNPFNPSTVISYQLPVTSNVNLKVYDILGNEVATLVNEEKQPGVYEVEFSAKGGSASGGNAYNLSSGIYFYQLKSSNYSSIKKMVLLK